MTAVLALCGQVAATQAAAWIAFGPNAMSVQAFAWVSVLALTTAIAAGTTMVGARATRSIAHVLHDVEHPARLSRL
jgi:hypothetical protein